MRKGIYFSRKDAERLLQVNKELGSVYRQLKAVTSETDKKHVLELQEQYERLSLESQTLEQRLQAYRERLNNIGNIKDKDSLEAFDEDIKVFLDSLNDYYEARIESYNDMYKAVSDYDTKKCGIIKKVRIWLLKVKIKRLIRYYRKKQKACVYIPCK